MSLNILLRTVFLQVPIIPNPVRVYRRSEFRIVYRKVERDIGFSLCAAPSQCFHRLNLREVREVVQRQTRENKQVECLSRYSNLRST